MKTLNLFPFFLSLFFFVFSIGFYPKFLPTAFRSTRHHCEKNTAHETKEASRERAKKRDRCCFFSRARLKRDEEENKNVESNDGVGIGIVVGERSLAGEPTER